MYEFDRSDPNLMPWRCAFCFWDKAVSSLYWTLVRQSKDPIACLYRSTFPPNIHRKFSCDHCSYVQSIVAKYHRYLLLVTQGWVRAVCRQSMDQTILFQRGVNDIVTTWRQACLNSLIEIEQFVSNDTIYRAFNIRGRPLRSLNGPSSCSAAFFQDDTQLNLKNLRAYEFGLNWHQLH